jgi:hypothetical protein
MGANCRRRMFCKEASCTVQYCALIYRPSFRENKPKALVFNDGFGLVFAKTGSIYPGSGSIHKDAVILTSYWDTPAKKTSLLICEQLFDEFEISFIFRFIWYPYSNYHKKFLVIFLATLKSNSQESLPCRFFSFIFLMTTAA